MFIDWDLAEFVERKQANTINKADFRQMQKKICFIDIDKGGIDRDKLG
jgi:hypothetical protein